MEELGILDSLKKIIRKNKALSKGMIALIVIGIIVIVSTSTFVAIYFTILKKEEPLRKTTFYISLTATSVIDNNKDSRFDELTFNLNNNYSGTLELYDTKLYLATIGDISNSTLWEPYLNWHLVSLGNITINPLENKEISLVAGDQLNLTAFEDYYCHLEFSNSTSAGVNQLTTNWFLINDYVSLTDLLPDYLSFNLDSYMDVYHDMPGTVENYQTSGGDYALVGDAINYLPVINETENIPFYYSSNFVIFQSPLGNLSALPISQEIIDPTSDRVRRIFLLGLAGSWGDEFSDNDAALTLDITYTDGTSSIWELGHNYIDDWFYNSNPGSTCISNPYGKITEIDLGLQIAGTHSHIHTHTASFAIDYFKYIQSISFIDPGNDNSAPHLLAVTLG